MARNLRRVTNVHQLHRTTAVPTHVPSSTGPQSLRGVVGGQLRRADSDSDSASDKRDDDSDSSSSDAKKDDDSDSDTKAERIAAPPLYTGDEDS
jgi:hypothetical protein